MASIADATMHCVSCPIHSLLKPFWAVAAAAFTAQNGSQQQMGGAAYTLCSSACNPYHIPPVAMLLSLAAEQQLCTKGFVKELMFFN